MEQEKVLIAYTEAQVDRFMLLVVIDYQTEEKLKLFSQEY